MGCRGFSFLLCALALVLVALPGRAASPAAAAGSCATTETFDAEEQAFLLLLNNHRAQNGLEPVVLSYTLSRAAQWKSVDLGVNRYFAHDDLTRSWVQRIRDCGYGYNTGLGEIIAAGNGTAQGAFNQWRNSPGHNNIMLGSGYRAVGIGRAYVQGSPYGWYWTAEFAGISDGWAQAQQSSTVAEPHDGTPTLSLDTTRLRGNSYIVSAFASDGGGITHVEFYIDGRRVASDIAAPYEIRARRGQVVSAVATDIDGNAVERELRLRK
jgi:uncharacterized protein YkwD